MAFLLIWTLSPRKYFLENFNPWTNEIYSLLVKDIMFNSPLESWASVLFGFVVSRSARSLHLIGLLHLEVRWMRRVNNGPYKRAVYEKWSAEVNIKKKFDVWKETEEISCLRTTFTHFWAGVSHVHVYACLRNAYRLTSHGQGVWRNRKALCTVLID